jgi:hypothetical protein
MTRHVSIPYHSSVCLVYPLEYLHTLLPYYTFYIHLTSSSIIHNGREVTVEAIQIRREAGGRHGHGRQKKRRQASTNGEQRDKPTRL